MIALIQRVSQAQALCEKLLKYRVFSDAQNVLLLKPAAQAKHAQVEAGQFGADMQVSLCNDGPVTFWLE